ncbi:hypothetical protein [Shewanella algae]|uniref:hypothetical protein n=1 Tax=Shewanella algae TaxID=38313 RepID=UPI001AAD9D0E|nr:hypothetical protein [Shewanella algae]MBO2558949.1 hypothetical protein [Shewanella algae]MBO2575898.1 hypothetical protein [Shewanella algae]
MTQQTQTSSDKKQKKFLKLETKYLIILGLMIPAVVYVLYEVMDRYLFKPATFAESGGDKVVQLPGELTEVEPGIEQPQLVTETVPGIEQPQLVTETVPGIEQPQLVTETVPGIEQPQQLQGQRQQPEILTFSKRVSLAEAEAAALEAEIKVRKLNQQLKDMQSPPKRIDLNAALGDGAGLSIPKKRRVTDQLEVKSLVESASGVQGVVSLAGEIIPVRTGSVIGPVTVVSLTRDSITFREGGVVKTKWLTGAAAIPTPVRGGRDGER